jgi:hypothetical protein
MPSLTQKQQIMGTKRGAAKAARRKRRRHLNSISLSSIICFYNGVSEGYLLSAVCISILRLILASADKRDNKIIGNLYENGKLQCDPK